MNSIHIPTQYFYVFSMNRSRPGADRTDQLFVYPQNLTIPSPGCMDAHHRKAADEQQQY